MNTSVWMGCVHIFKYTLQTFIRTTRALYNSVAEKIIPHNCFGVQNIFLKENIVNNALEVVGNTWPLKLTQLPRGFLDYHCQNFYYSS